MKSFVTFIHEFRKCSKTLVIILFSEIKGQVEDSDTLEAADKNKSINLSWSKQKLYWFQLLLFYNIK